MEKKDLRIVYLGTPDFAVESLRRLVEGGYHVVGVVTTPDKPVGRHQNHLQPSAVKTYALEHGLPLLQPEKLRNEDFLAALRELRADLQIVVAFRMLPEAVWAMPRWGTFNLHASLLPQYRGAAPINWALMNGEKETGITTFFLDKDIDTGAMIDRVKVTIGEDEDFGQLHDRLMTLGGDLVIKTVDAILEGGVESTPQRDEEGVTLKPAPKITRETCRIDWTRGLEAVHNHVRGLSPAPTAWTMLHTSRGEEMLKVFRTRKIAEAHQRKVGEVVTDGRSYLHVAVDGGYVDVLDLQIAGKKRMPVADFLNGWKDTEGLTVQ